MIKQFRKYYEYSNFCAHFLRGLFFAVAKRLAFSEQVYYITGHLKVKHKVIELIEQML